MSCQWCARVIAHVRGRCSSRTWSMWFTYVVDVVHVRGRCGSRTWSMWFTYVVDVAHVRWTMTKVDVSSDGNVAFGQ